MMAAMGLVFRVAFDRLRLSGFGEIEQKSVRAELVEALHFTFGPARLKKDGPSSFDKLRISGRTGPGKINKSAQPELVEGHALTEEIKT